MIRLLALSLVLCVAAGTAHAAAAGKKPEVAFSWPHEGIFGNWDYAALQRGFLVYKQVCSACHAMEMLDYRHLEDIGFSPTEVQAIAAEYEVEDGPDDEGQMFTRPAMPSDDFVKPYANEAAARFANNGAYPKDLSLVVKARKYQTDYIYKLLLGYTDPPADHDELLPGQYWNSYYKGNVFSMAPPLFDDAVEYLDGTPATEDQMARDVAQFLTWAAEPTMDERKEMGFRVMLFLIIFAGVLYVVKKRVWKDAH